VSGLLSLGCGTVESSPAEASKDTPPAGTFGSNERPSDPEPEPRPAPAGGTLVQEIWGASLAAPASEGVVWMAGCAGLSRVDADGVRLYSWLNSPLPENIIQVFVDARRRPWVIAQGPERQSLFTEDNGEWQRVLEAVSVDSISAGVDGTAWVSATSNDGYTLQQVLPQVGEPVPAPDSGVSGLVAAEDGALWARAYGSVQYWQGGSWSTPFQTLYSSDLKPAQGGVWFAEEGIVHVLQWTGSAIEQVKAIEFPRLSQPQGFDASGRLVLRGDQQIQWIKDGELENFVFTEPLLDGRLQLASDGELYVQTRKALYVYRGDGPRLVVALSEKPGPDWFPWEARFGQSLREAGIDATRADLVSLNPEVMGKKLRVVGRLYGGFETSGIRFGDVYEGAVWPEVAPELERFMRDHGLDPYGEAQADDVSYPNEDWELYGYLETPGCFGHLGGSERRFWIVEAYPVSMDEAARDALKAELRSRNPE
jgi:hypothetical protein